MGCSGFKLKPNEDGLKVSADVLRPIEDWLKLKGVGLELSVDVVGGLIGNESEEGENIGRRGVDADA